MEIYRFQKGSLDVIFTGSSMIFQDCYFGIVAYAKLISSSQLYDDDSDFVFSEEWKLCYGNAHLTGSSFELTLRRDCCKYLRRVSQKYVKKRIYIDIVPFDGSQFYCSVNVEPSENLPL